MHCIDQNRRTYRIRFSVSQSTRFFHNEIQKETKNQTFSYEDEWVAEF